MSASNDRGGATARSGPSGRLFAFSDIHTDKPENMEWLRCLETETENGISIYKDDTLILAGDVTHRPDITRETLELLSRSFRQVFYCPGNHDLWVKGVGAAYELAEPTTGQYSRKTSLDRLDELNDLCRELGIHTKPALSPCGVIVAPILSWHHPQWDTEPDIVGWTGIPRIEEMSMDYHMTVWPSGIKQEDGTAAQLLDQRNDDGHIGGFDGIFGAVEDLKRRYPEAPIVTFSHFVPRVELCREKRFLFFPNLSKAIGSDHLKRRIDALKPKVHVFGHTHFGWDVTLNDGVRYIQAPLAYPHERRTRLASIACGDTFPRSTTANPLLIYDSQTQSFAPKYMCEWSGYYETNERRPDIDNYLPSYVARRYQIVPGGVGKIGWGP